MVKPVLGDLQNGMGAGSRVLPFRASLVYYLGSAFPLEKMRRTDGAFSFCCRARRQPSPPASQALGVRGWHLAVGGAFSTWQPIVPATLSLKVAPPRRAAGGTQGLPQPGRGNSKVAREPQPQGRPSRRWADSDKAGSFLSNSRLWIYKPYAFCPHMYAALRIGMPNYELHGGTSLGSLALGPAS